MAQPRAVAGDEEDPERSRPVSSALSAGGGGLAQSVSVFGDSASAASVPRLVAFAVRSTIDPRTGCRPGNETPHIHGSRNPSAWDVFDPDERSSNRRSQMQA